MESSESAQSSSSSFDSEEDVCSVILEDVPEYSVNLDLPPAQRWSVSQTQLSLAKLLSFN